MDIVTYALLNGKIKDYASNVDKWLEENVDPDTGYVLDRSLQMENAAAPADMVGDINGEVGNLKNTFVEQTITDNYELTQITGHTYDDSNGVYLAISGYVATPKIIYTPSLSFIGRKTYKALYWGANENYLGYTTSSISAPNGTRYIAFTWQGGVVSHAYYSRIAELQNDINEISGDLFNVENVLHTVDITLINNSRWDNTTDNPTYYELANNKRSDTLIIYNANAVFESDANDDLFYIFYDKTKTKVGTGRSLNSVPTGAFFFVFYAPSTISISTAKYQYFSNGIESVKIGETSLPKDANNNVTLPVATENSDGLMSHEDKNKLDNLPSDISITIEGSGVTKNASAFGFLPTNDGYTNATNLQSCVDSLNGGGTVIVDLPGTYYISRTVKLPSNTSIIFGAKVFLQRTAYDGKYSRHIFANIGAYPATDTEPPGTTVNENITIKGLKINSAQVSGTEIGIILQGIRGLVAFCGVKNAVIDGFELIDRTYTDYAIHVTLFDGLKISNVHIETLKDGIHFGKGKNFELKNCRFLTNDDCIALNCVDYPLSNFGTGNIENGLIENITLLSASGISGYSRKRGILMFTGAWKNWQSGNTYHNCGDFCTNNGRIYQTVQASPDGQSSTASVAPTHTAGTVQGADGLRWAYRGESTELYAVCKNIVFRNIYVERDVLETFFISAEDSNYIRAVYPGATIVPNANITFENINFISASQVNARCLIGLNNAVDTMRISNSDIRKIGEPSGNSGPTGIIVANKAEGVSSHVHVSCVGNNYDTSVNFINNNTGETMTVSMSISGSMKASGFSFATRNVTPTMLANDLS